MTHRLVPLAAGPDAVECRWYVPARRPTPIDPAYAVDFWDITNREDWARLRVGAARPRIAALPARAVRPRRGRRPPVGDDDRPRVPGQLAPARPRWSASMMAQGIDQLGLAIIERPSIPTCLARSYSCCLLRSS